MEIAVGIERFQLPVPVQWRMICQLSGELVRRVRRCDRFNIRSHAGRSDNREEQENPNEIQYPESSLGNAVNCTDRYIG